ncbi:MAG: DUF3098 domain-containing protein [Bacteroidaceae bacterium]|nr:DUF3098 domain-containing protein [Bacteroidaceae bacterium]
MKNRKKNVMTASMVRTVIYTLSTLLILNGLFLMSGDGSDYETFRPEIFSATRIRIAPALCFFGYLLVILGIMYRGKDK